MVSICRTRETGHKTWGKICKITSRNTSSWVCPVDFDGRRKMSTLSLKAVVVHNSVTSFMMGTNLRKGGLVHQVPCAKSREKLQEFCLYRQRKLKILNVEDERSLNGQKEILVNFQNDAKIYIYIYIYVYMYICIYVYMYICIYVYIY